MTLLSPEAGYVELTQVTQEFLWILKLYNDFNIQQKFRINIFEDNHLIVKLVDSEQFKSRTKHMDTKYDCIKDLKIKR